MAQEGSDLKLADQDDGSTPDQTEEIKEQIEDTRSQIGETIDAIQEKLSFSNISEQVSETVSNAVESASDAAYKATIGRVANYMKNIGDGISKAGVLKAAKTYPLPFILIGTGVGLLAYKAFSDGNSGNNRRGLSLPANSGRDNEQSEGENSGTISNAYDKVTSLVSDTSSRARDGVSAAYQKVGDVGSTAFDQLGTYMEQNPLAVGAVALAVGAAVGMAMPSTSYENRLMGTKRQELFETAQNKASDLLSDGKEMVTEASKAVMEKVM